MVTIQLWSRETMNKKKKLVSSVLKLSFLLLVTSLIATVVQGQDIDDVRDTLKEWVAVEKTISQEQADWVAEKALLNDLLSSLDQEERILRETISASQQDTSRADEERLELISRQEAYEQSATVFQERLSLYEMQARQLIPRLPTLLKDEIAPMVNRLYLTEGANYSLSERAQTLVSILSAVQDFDSAITVGTEIRTLASGEQVEVKVLFLGLSRAYFADTAKRTAGIGGPVAGGSDEGWQWREQDDLADDIIRAIDIYENRESPALISLPLEIERN